MWLAGTIMALFYHEEKFEPDMLHVHACACTCCMCMYMSCTYMTCTCTHMYMCMHHSLGVG